MWLLIGCTTPAWHGERAVLSVGVDVLTFSPTPLGTAGSASVVVSNDGGADALVDVSIVGPFTPDRTSMELAAGAALDLSVLYTPTAYGSTVGILSLAVADGPTLEVPIVATTDPDSDGDGHYATDVAGDDCDDGRADVLPGAAEVDDGADQDCDGRIDEGSVVAGDVVISEIHPAFPAWVELCAARDLPLVGWTLQGEPLATTDVPAGGCVVLCERDDPGCTSTLALDLEEDADTLALVADDEVDTVTWDTTWPDTSGRTRSLSADQTTAQANDSPDAWCITDGTAGSPNPPC